MIFRQMMSVRIKKLVSEMGFHFLKIFLATFETHLEPHLGTRFAQEAAKMSPRGASGASKTKKLPFQNP